MQATAIGLISPTQSSPGQTIEADDINTPINQLAAVINGNIETANLADSAVTTAKVADDSVTAAKMQYGMVRNRQGGAAGDATWQTQGTTNVDTSSKAVFIQCGVRVGAGSGTDVAITFPTAYNFAPIVIATPQTAGAANVYAIVSAVTTTGCNVRQIGGTGVENIGWMAIGQ